MTFFVGGIGQDYIPTFAQKDFIEQSLRKESKSSLAQGSRSSEIDSIDLYGTASAGIDTYNTITTKSFIKSSGERQEEQATDPCTFIPPYFDNRLQRQMVRGGGVYPSHEDFIDYPDFQSIRAPAISNYYRNAYRNSPSESVGQALRFNFP